MPRCRSGDRRRPVGAHWSALVGCVLGALLASTVLPGLAPGATAMGYGLAGSVGAVALVVSLLAHELGHAVIARRSGLEARRITLWPLDTCHRDDRVQHFATLASTPRPESSTLDGAAARDLRGQPSSWRIRPGY